MINPFYLCDFYKISHYEQYPKGTKMVFSNFTPRKIQAPYQYSVFFGLEYFIKKYLNPLEWLKFDLEEFKKIMRITLGNNKDFNHLNELKDYILHNGKLPLTIYAVPELTKVKEKTPMLILYNNDDRFYWLTNYIETILSATLWKGCMSATVASHFRDIVDKWGKETGCEAWFLDYQCHDFSMRGQPCLEAALLSGCAHLQYFKGTDTLPAILFNDQYYNNPIQYLASIPATEHSVMCSYGKENELETYENLISNVYPSGLVSIVSDTWDFWNVIENYLPKLKNKILNRDGKVVIRPDSGDPYKIICGDINSDNEIERKGLLISLFEIFGGYKNEKGFIKLDDHIGMIYGDSITLDVCNSILEDFYKKGFCSSNIVFGIGSYSYQYNTRDTLGFAIKATAIKNKDNEIVPIFKSPKTDNGLKKSNKGLITVNKDFEIIEHDSMNSFENSLKDSVYVKYY